MSPKIPLGPGWDYQTITAQREDGSTELNFSVYKGHVEKPDLDDREYRHVQLENGLRALLIHDAQAEKAAACVTVQVGAMHDPPDVQGLAHFCEHMISKGSELFPEEEDFSAYVSSNGGVRNAGTASSSADYWFSISAAYLSGALARTAAFFHCPLFTESLTKREIHAVDSEYRRNIQNDGRRILQIDRSLSLPNHPYAQFSTGNVDTITEAARQMQKEGRLLSGRDGKNEDSDENAVWKETRRRLVEWWQQQYCAGRMTLAVLGRESIDELTEMVVRLFSPIVNRGLDPRPIFTQPVWGPNEMGSIIFVKTVKDYYKLGLAFMIPDQRPHYATQPATVIAHFLEHEGPGSIYAYLKKKGWLLGISASPWRRNPSVQQLKISVKLTKDGYAHYKDVLLTIYNYISLLRSSPLDPYHFHELRTMSLLHFRFQEKTQPHEYVEQLAWELAEPHAPERILSGPVIVRDWDESLVREILVLCVPEKGRITLEAREHPDEIVGSDAQWEKEKHLGGEYCVQRLDPALVQKAQANNENQDLFLPARNPFIPTNLNVAKLDVSEPAKAPTCIRRTPLSTLWHKKDDQFWVPKAEVKVEIKSPVAYGTARQAVLTHLLVSLVEDALSEMTYAAWLAELYYVFASQPKGITLVVAGYSDKLSTLMSIVLDKLKRIEVDEARMAIAMEDVKRGWENFYLGQPSNLSDQFGAWALMDSVWTPANKLAELELITTDDIQRHRDDLLAKVFIEAVIDGNFDKEYAITLIESVEQCLSARPLLPAERPLDRALDLPVGSNIVLRTTHANPKETNSSLSYYLQFGTSADDTLRPVLELIGHVMKEPAHTQLRTKEQLGYVVYAGSYSYPSLLLNIKIQSTKPPWTLEERVNVFLTSFRETLVVMAEQPEQWEGKKEGLIVKKLERARNMSEEAARFGRRVWEGNYDFGRDERDASVIRMLTVERVLEAYDRYVLPSSPPSSLSPNLPSKTRKKLSVHLLSQQIQDPASWLLTADVDGALVMDADDAQIALFKAGLPCYPAPVPVEWRMQLRDMIVKKNGDMHIRTEMAAL